MKIAVIGSGSAGSKHLRALRTLKGIIPVAVPHRQSRIAELETDGFATAPDIHAAVGAGVCGAIIATDTARHLHDSQSALAEGLDLLVEKPLDINYSEASELENLAKGLGRQVYVACVLRFSESLNTFRELLPEAGALHSVQVTCGSYLPDWRPARPYLESYSARAEEGGVLRDLVHEIDYTGWLFGWPSATSASVRNLGRLGIEADEIANLHWETPNGCLVSVSLDFLSRTPKRQVVASGENGSIQWDGISQTVTVQPAASDTKVIHSSQSLEQLFAAQAQAFVGALRGDGDARLASGADGVRGLAICDAARRSSATRREEPVVYS